MKQVNLADFPLKMSLSARLGSAGGGTWESPQENYFNTFTSIWHRRPELYHASSDLNSEVRKFLEREAYYAFIGLLESCQTCLVSSPIAIQRAAFKALHLATAQRCGINVPKTLITNEPEAVQAFFDECNGKIVCKTIYDNMIKGDDHNYPQNIYTTLITKDHLEKLDGVRKGAHLFQEAFTSCRDIRVTIFGKRCIATEIVYTQERSNVDWRTEYDKHAYVPHTLPNDLEEKLLAFVKSYGLQYSAIDLLLVDGTYYLIDENPSGQFYWIEQKNPDIHLASAMADLLCFPQEFRL
jgi:glutathione synthase/RimK-type ligase-like ATP-grasp enzyme